MYNPSHSSQSQWKFAPVKGKKDTFQIISMNSNQALAMTKVEGQKEYQVRLQQPDQQDQKQHWQILDAETEETLSASNQQYSNNVSDSNESDF